MAVKRPSSSSRKADRGRASRKIYQSTTDKRKVLAHLAMAKRAASGNITRMINAGRKAAGVPDLDAGEHLKASMMAMVDRMGGNAAEYAAIEKLDPKVLDAMYKDNKLSFEVFFNYEGIENKGGMMFVEEQKHRDVDWFLNNYNRYASNVY